MSDERPDDPNRETTKDASHEHDVVPESDEHVVVTPEPPVAADTQPDATTSADGSGETAKSTDTLRVGGVAIQTAVSQLSSRLREALNQAAVVLAEQAKASAEQAQASAEQASPGSEQESDAGLPAVAAEAPVAEATPPITHVESLGNVVNLAAERLKRRGLQKQVDLKSLIKETFAHFVQEQGVTTVDEEGGTKRVTIDGAFLTQHGAGLVPALVGGLAEALFGAAKTTDEPKEAATAKTQDADAVAPASEVAEPAQAPESGDGGVDAGSAPTVPAASDSLHVAFDVKSLLGLLFTTATKGVVIKPAEQRVDSEPRTQGNKEADAAEVPALKAVDHVEDDSQTDDD